MKKLKIICCIASSTIILFGCENATTMPSSYLEKIDTDDNIYDASTDSSFSQEELLQIARTFTDNEVYGTPIYGDFNGDGREDLVIEGGKEIPDDDYGIRVQYFVFTDGITTYKFAEKEDPSYLYATDAYMLNVSGKGLLIVNSEWRPAALGGYMQRSEVYSFDPQAHCLFDQEFTEITGTDASRQLAYINYYEVPTPGSFLKDKGILWYNNDKLYPIRETSGISDEYKSARIKPQDDPRQVWDGEDVTEITGLWGVHFYVPSNWTVSCDYWENPNMENIYYNATDGQGNEASVVSTFVCSKGFQFDFGLDSMASYLLGSDDQYDYYFRILSDDFYMPDFYEPPYFPEFSGVSDKILKTAWFE